MCKLLGDDLECVKPTSIIYLEFYIRFDCHCQNQKVKYFLSQYGTLTKQYEKVYAVF